MKRNTVFPFSGLILFLGQHRGRFGQVENGGDYFISLFKITSV
jgi:hypothetical protein